MILAKLQKTPEKMIPVAMALVVTGLMLIVVCTAWSRLPLSFAHMGADWSDFFRGMLTGIAIALEIGGVVIASAAAAAKRKLS
jgi:hypothetical protein